MRAGRALLIRRNRSSSRSRRGSTTGRTQAFAWVTRSRLYANRGDVLVLALPRGGVPVAAHAAEKLNAPLDILLVRKLGVPFHRELGMGAIATGGIRIINKEIVDGLGISTEDIDTVACEEEQELERREKAYRGDAPVANLEGKTVILVDDGIATGSTMLAAIAAARQLKAAHIVVAVPTVAASTYHKMREAADDVVALAHARKLLRRRSIGTKVFRRPQIRKFASFWLRRLSASSRAPSMKAKPHRKQRRHPTAAEAPDKPPSRI